MKEDNEAGVIKIIASSSGGFRGKFKAVDVMASERQISENNWTAMGSRQIAI